jgi:periplasmic divalent cation tolerance protein
MSDDDQAEDIEICEIVITAPDAEWLATFCRSLIEDRLAAAVHIIEDIRTLYRWQGEIHDTHEARAHIRTRMGHIENIAAKAKASHPYQVPSITMFCLVALNGAYSDWIVTMTEPLA